jgi:aromatic ring-opening dioxygenase catalytic subunit (LigB family)
MAQIVSVICSSHTPGFMVAPEQWQVIHGGRVEQRSAPLSDHLRAMLEAETPDVTKKQHAACMAALNRLRGFFQAAQADLVIMFGDDQRENFHTDNMPPFCVYTGESSFGYPWKILKTVFGQDSGPRFEIPGSPDVATNLVRIAAEKNFDLSWSREFADKEWGLPHSMIRIVEKLDIKIPLIPIYINAFEEPTATPRRCFDLGRMIKGALDELLPPDTRVAIIGSGGLSHEASGTNAGWIDAKHDQEVLDKVKAGDYETLANMSSADLARVWNQEFRNWLAALGCAGGAELEYMEYVLSYRSLVGNAFAAWSFPGTKRAA